LRNRTLIDRSAIADAVVKASGDPTDVSRLARLGTSIDAQLKKQRLTGLDFKPDPQILKRSARRQLRTVEGILIEYPSELEGAIVNRTIKADGSVTIVINTKKVEDDNLIREQSRTKN
jgi:hypothetical protein